jgi:penicillin amidase
MSGSLTSTACLFAFAASLTENGHAAESAESLLAKSKAVLSQLEGEIRLPGLQSPVEVLRDRWGVPHIYAQNQHDLFFAQGFVAAQDRLFQMDMWRRIAIGETAAVLGKQAIEADRFARLVKYRGDMQAEWTSYSPDTQQIATSFTAGINACIDQAGDRLPIEFQLAGFRPGKWRPEDCLGRMSGVIMTRNFRQEVARAQLVAAVGVERARWLAPTDPVRDFAPAAGLDLSGIGPAVLAGYEAATRLAEFSTAPEGSNNWAIDGTLSRSGKPLMASDPHRALGLPALRHLVHLNAPGWNCIGAGEPGLPGVALGHNDHVAWGITIVGTDQADLYVEETKPGDPTQYRTPDGWQPMKIEHEALAVRGQAEPEKIELRFTRHGAVIHQDLQSNRAYVLQWAGSQPGAAAYLASLGLDRSRTLPEFKQAIRNWKIPSLNIVYADVDGNIGWVAAGAIPVRKGWDGLLPVPGAEGKFEWKGFLELEEYPQAHNPAEHFIATANHNILPPGYRHEIAYEWAPNYRYDRIRERLTSQSQFTLQDCVSIQHDDTSIAGRQLAALARHIRSDNPEVQRQARLLSDWNGSLTRDSPAGALYGVWLRELLDNLYRPHVPQELLAGVATQERVPVLLAALEKPAAQWFGDDPTAGRDRLLREAFESAVKRLGTLISADSTSWTWGKLHTLTFRHPLAGLSDAHAKAFSLGPLGRPGDGLSPNATRSDDKFQQVNGATYRHVFDLADWDLGVATSAPGQSGQPGSPHYADLLPLWAEGQTFPLVYSRQRVEEVTAHKLLLTPQR